MANIFSTWTDNLIRNRIVGRIRTDQMRARLLREADLPYIKAIDICRASEASSRELKEFNDDNVKSRLRLKLLCNCYLLNFSAFYSACCRRGGVLKCPVSVFFFGVESWAAAHGLYRCTDCYTDCYSEPMSTRLLNSISSRICRENTQFNMYTTTSKQQEGCTFKDSHPKCFITTNFDKFHREAFARGGESR